MTLRRLLACCVAAVALVAALPAAAALVDIGATSDVPLRAHWLPAPGATAARPAVVLLHGCGGLYRRDGTTLDARTQDYVTHLHAAGYHLLLPDSLGSRGSGPICTERNGERRVTVTMRAADAAAAVRWLAARSDVDARRIALLGWSHGATTTLAALSAGSAERATPVAGAVVFYPGCRALLRRPYALDTPLLMLLGAADDWTPAAPCEALVARLRTAAANAPVTLHVYADAHHGFDSAAPVRFRADVPNGVDARGVHVGGNPAARLAARAELDSFLARIFE